MGSEKNMSPDFVIRENMAEMKGTTTGEGLEGTDMDTMTTKELISQEILIQASEMSILKKTSRETWMIELINTLEETPSKLMKKIRLLMIHRKMISQNMNVVIEGFRKIKFIAKD
jgi:hypothetical protein